MTYVVKRTGTQGDGWVNQPGSANSYTNYLQHACRYPTRAAAEADRCADDEVVEEFI